MKIWIDIRDHKNLDKNFFLFLQRLISNTIKENNENNYTIYLNEEIDYIFPENAKIRITENKPWTIKEQSFFLHELKEDNNDLMIFTSIYRPIFYKNKSIFIIDSLKEITYPEKENLNIINKYKYIFFLKESLKLAEKIICLDNNTKSELNQRLNINESKIEVINWAFEKDQNTFEMIDIKRKFNIKNDFIIYEGSSNTNKNLGKLLKSFKVFLNKNNNLDLVFIWDKICSNINLREIIIKENLENNIFNLWNINESDIYNLYKQSKAFIFPSIYEWFPFELNKALSHNSIIFSSSIPSLKEILVNEPINYFSALSNYDFTNKLESLLKEDKNPDYSNIFKKYNINDSSKKLANIIKTIK